MNETEVADAIQASNIFLNKITEMGHVIFRSEIRSIIKLNFNWVIVFENKNVFGTAMIDSKTGKMVEMNIH